MEFALVLPLVLVMLLGLVQVGLSARNRLLLEAAARAAARAAAVEPDPERARSAAIEASPGLDEGALRVETLRHGGRGSPVEVTVTYDDVVRVPFITWLVGDVVHMRTVAVMRQEFG